MTDMPDTTTKADPSRHADSEQESDDAAGYYEPGDPIQDNKAPEGPIDERWNTRQFEARIANPANRRRLSVIVVGTGLAGASAAANGRSAREQALFVNAVQRWLIEHTRLGIPAMFHERRCTASPRQAARTSPSRSGSPARGTRR